MLGDPRIDRRSIHQHVVWNRILTDDKDEDQFCY